MFNTWDIYKFSILKQVQVLNIWKICLCAYVSAAVAPFLIIGTHRLKLPHSFLNFLLFSFGLCMYTSDQEWSHGEVMGTHRSSTCFKMLSEIIDFLQSLYMSQLIQVLNICKYLTFCIYKHLNMFNIKIIPPWLNHSVDVHLRHIIGPKTYHEGQISTFSITSPNANTMQLVGVQCNWLESGKQTTRPPRLFRIEDSAATTPQSSVWGLK